MPLTSIHEKYRDFRTHSDLLLDILDLDTVGQSISFVPKFRSISFEELRLNDYRALDAPGTGNLKHDAQHTDSNAGGGAIATSHEEESSVVAIFLNPTLHPVPLRTLRMRSKANIYGADVITIRVGTEPSRDFIVHEKLIAANSDFVAMTMKSDWKETKDRVIPLPADEPETFEIYQIWLYERIICIPSDDGKPHSETDFPMLASAYIFADKMLDFDFRDAIIDCIIEQIRCTSTFDVSLIEGFYCKTLPDSPLRRLLCHLYASVGSQQWLKQLQPDSEVQAEFMKDVLGYLASNSTVPSKNNSLLPHFLSNTCIYHQHPHGVCYKKTQT